MDMALGKSSSTSHERPYAPPQLALIIEKKNRYTHKTAQRLANREKNHFQQIHLRKNISSFTIPNPACLQDRNTLKRNEFFSVRPTARGTSQNEFKWR